MRSLQTLQDNKNVDKAGHKVDKGKKYPTVMGQNLTVMDQNLTKGIKFLKDELKAIRNI